MAGFIYIRRRCLFLSFRFYRIIRYQQSFELSLNEQGLSLLRNTGVITIHYSDLSSVLKSKKHLVVLGRYPEQVIVIPNGMEGFASVENTLRSLRPVQETGKVLPFNYARLLTPPRRGGFAVYALVLVAINILIVFLSPSSPDKNRHKKTPAVAGPHFFSAVDSFEKYMRTDSLIIQRRDKFYAGYLNSIDFGIYEANDSQVVFYFKEGPVWKTSEKIVLPLNYLNEVKCLDVNGDGLKDIRISGSEPDGYGKDISYSLIYDKTDNRFRRNKNFDLTAVFFDPESKRVFCEDWDEITGADEKKAYLLTPEKDSLLFAEGVDFIPDSAANSNKASVEFYTLKESKRAVSRKYSGDYEKMWALYVKSLWVSE